MDKTWSKDSELLLQKIDWKIGKMESTLLKTYGFLIVEEKYEIHLIFLEVVQMLIELYQKDPMMTPLVKALSLQLQSIQEKYYQLLDMSEVY